MKYILLHLLSLTVYQYHNVRRWLHREASSQEHCDVLSRPSNVKSLPVRYPFGVSPLRATPDRGLRPSGRFAQLIPLAGHTIHRANIAGMIFN
jgi:hypothetical protein